MPYTYTFEDIRSRPVAVIGAGTLGRRIALMFASRGGTVRIYARREQQLAAATQYVAESLPRVIEDR
ncbi:MAG: 3-hydroxybutyryl-CoA dehydrogenase, partial [Mycobacterium sp.]|nr:3-hydroxybutyryl-CoA dehydrogenase [Mycobacterium sp.]MDT5355413.1 3-hydroxybutyryl-CoA dehydrogenase [Mycobacterium sp.]